MFPICPIVIKTNSSRQLYKSTNHTYKSLIVSNELFAFQLFHSAVSFAQNLHLHYVMNEPNKIFVGRFFSSYFLFATESPLIVIAHFIYGLNILRQSAILVVSLQSILFQSLRLIIKLSTSSPLIKGYHEKLCCSIKFPYLCNIFYLLP